MLSGPSFSSVFIFNINSLILCGFPLTPFYVAKASLSAFSWVELSKRIMKCLSFTIIQIFSTYFAINLFYLDNLKT